MWSVTPNSIRLRILKELLRREANLAASVTPNSIRLRILKGTQFEFARADEFRYTELDPLEDTERAIRTLRVVPADSVTPNSIRLRILKGAGLC